MEENKEELGLLIKNIMTGSDEIRNKACYDFGVFDIGNRQEKWYQEYFNQMSWDDKLKLLDATLMNYDYNNFSACHRLFNIIDISPNGYLYQNYHDKLMEIYHKVLEFDKKSIYNINYENVPYVYIIKELDPLYPIKKNINYLQKIPYNSYLVDYIEQILNYCISINYEFNYPENANLIQLIIAKKLLKKFLSECNYAEDVAVALKSNIQGNIAYISEIIKRYPSVGNNIPIDIELNNVDDSLKVIDNFKNLKENGYNGIVTINIKRLDENYIDRLHDILGNQLLIRPNVNANFAENSYKYEEYKKKNNVINMYAKSLADYRDKDGNIKSLSPLEKYIAAYIITIHFAKYNKVGEADDPRSIYQFIDIISGTPIVCVGYVSLLNELLLRNGIDAFHWRVKSKREGDEKSDNHDRSLIHLQDSKYGIDGIYISDPTWENHELHKAPFSHLLMSFDELAAEYSDFDNPIANMHLDKVGFSKMNGILNIANSEELIRRPIPKETIIKAFCAVDRFIDLESKMEKTSDKNAIGFDIIEFNQKAMSLGKIENVYLDNELYHKSFKELIDYFTTVYGNENAHYLIMEMLCRRIDLPLFLVFSGDKVEIKTNFTFDLQKYQLTNDEFEKIYEHFNQDSSSFPTIELQVQSLSITDKFDKVLVINMDDIEKVKNDFYQEIEELINQDKRSK